MIQNRNLSRGARKREWRGVIDISAANLQRIGFSEKDHDVRILTVEFIYSVATDAGTVPENLQVGTAASLGLYFSGAPTASQAAGTIQAKTVASTALLAKNTALLIGKSAATGGTNTGEVTVQVGYERIDGPINP